MKRQKVYTTETQERLLRLYRRWEQQYPGTLQWRKTKARQTDWWDRAAAVCEEQSVPPELLMYLAYAFANLRPEDAEIPFSANTMRSESLLYRALANYRSATQAALHFLEPLHYLAFHKELELPDNTLDLSRMIAELSVQYFETTLMIRKYELKRHNVVLPASMEDALAYKACDRNPFLLLRTAKTPRIRAIAAVNAFFVADRLPWHFSIWEGIASRESLLDPDRMAGVEVRQFYEGGHIQHAWPLQCMEHIPISGIDDGPMPLELHLLQFPLCHNTDLFLSTKRNAARSGLPDPYTP